MAIWRQHTTTQETEVLHLVDETGQCYLPDSLRFSLLSGEE